MRICIISGSFPPAPCGVGDSTKSIAAELSRRGHEVTVVTTMSDDPAAKRDDSSYAVEPVIVSWGLRNLPRVARIVSRLEPEMVLLQYPTSAYRRQVGIFLLPLTIRLMRCTGLQCLIMIVHEFRRTRWVKKLAIAFMIGSARRALVFPEDIDSLRRFLPMPLLRITERPPSPPSFPDAFVCRSDLADLRDELGCAEGQALVVYFGFISPRKGLRTLIDAIAQLISTREVRVHLVVAGGAAPGMASWVDDLEKEAISLGLGDRITWCGYQEDQRVLQLLKAADMCVLPFDDGFSPGSASFAQAAACGVPIITTQPPAGSASAKRVVDGVHVLLFPPGDSRALARAIRRLIEETDVRDRLRANVRQLAADQADTVQAILESADPDASFRQGPTR
jgi:glycosyltransferase involved in cell wall biosynthesis